MVRSIVVLDKRTRNKEGKYPLRLRVTNYSDVRFISLNAFFTEKQYEDIFKKSIPDYIEVRNFIENIQIKSQKLISEVVPFDFRIFKELLFKKEKEKRPQSFFIKDIVAEMILKYKENEQLKSAESFKTTLNSLEKYHPNLRIQDITVEFINNYEKQFISNRGKHTATVNIYLRNLRTIINHLKDNELLPKDYKYPFGRKGYRFKSYNRLKKTLVRDEIVSIIELNEFESDFQRYSRDLWLMQYYCNGINFKDLIKLRWSDRNGDVFEIIREKTKRTCRVENQVPVCIPITSKLQNIINKLGKPDSPFVLGLLNEGCSESTIMNKKKKVSKLINKELKSIQIKLKLSVPLQMKTSRDAYATSLKKSGRSLEEIAEMLGQTSTAVTRNYLDSFDRDVKHAMNNDLP